MLGGRTLYMRTRETVAPPPAPVLAEADRACTAELLPSFRAAPDAFAVDPAEAAAVRLLLNGETAFARKSAVAAGEPLRTEPLPALAEPNALYVEAFPPATGAPGAYALRLRVLCADRVVREATFWAEGGRAVTGAVTFTPEERQTTREGGE